jgi:hypothetical protein
VAAVIRADCAASSLRACIDAIDRDLARADNRPRLGGAEARAHLQRHAGITQRKIRKAPRPQPGRLKNKLRARRRHRASAVWRGSEALADVIVADLIVNA